MLLTMSNFMATPSLQHYKKYSVIASKSKETFGSTAALQMDYFQLNLTLNYGHKHQHQLLVTCTSTITIWTVKTGLNSQHLDLCQNSDFSHNLHSSPIKEY
jgi:hypothetical protein